MSTIQSNTYQSYPSTVNTVTHQSSENKNTAPICDLYSKPIGKMVLKYQDRIYSEAMRHCLRAFRDENITCKKNIERKIQMTNATEVALPNGQNWYFRAEEITKRIDFKKMADYIDKYNTGIFEGLYTDQLIKFSIKVINEKSEDLLQLLAAYEPNIIMDLPGHKAINPALSTVVQYYVACGFANFT